MDVKVGGEGGGRGGVRSRIEYPVSHFGFRGQY